MKGWAKKMIWFFGASLLFDLEWAIFYYFEHTGSDKVSLTINLLTIIVPLFFLNDDVDAKK